jgi:hypothetical protein
VHKNSRFPLREIITIIMAANDNPLAAFLSQIEEKFLEVEAVAAPTITQLAVASAPVQYNPPPSFHAIHKPTPPTHYHPQYRTVKEAAPDEIVYAIHGGSSAPPTSSSSSGGNADGTSSRAAAGGNGQGAHKKKMRMAAGKVYEDKKLEEWPDGDYRLFVGNLGGDVRDDVLAAAFSEYPSMHRVRVVRDKEDKSRGFGFVGFTDAFEMLRAMREKNGKLCGSRPMMIKKSTAEERDAKVVQKQMKDKHKEAKKLARLGGASSS